MTTQEPTSLAAGVSKVLTKSTADWPVERAAVAVVGTGGVIAVVGDPGSFRWASVSKVVTALAVLDVVADGLLRLDSPSGPEGSTVRHLLSHASGMAMDSDEVLAAPGTRRIYSNRGIEIAAAAAADAAGVSVRELLAERVLEPLGMGAVLDGSAAHGLSGTIGDLAALAGELLTPRQTLPGVVGGISTLAFPGLSGILPGYGRQSNNDWGLGCEIKDGKAPHWTAPENSPVTFGHFGQSGSFLWVDPVAKLACVALADSPFGPWAIEAWPPLSSAVLRFCA